MLPTHRLRNPYDLVSTQSEGQLPHRISGAAQHEEEPVSDFIRRIERIFRSAYGRDPMSSETRETLLYGQLQEGLRLQLMRGPAVSGARNYQELCVAARNEEKRLANLRKRQEYSKLLANTSSSQRTVRLKPPADSGPSRGGLASPPTTLQATMRPSFKCHKTGHRKEDCRRRWPNLRAEDPVALLQLPNRFVLARIAATLLSRKRTLLDGSVPHDQHRRRHHFQWRCKNLTQLTNRLSVCCSLTWRMRVSSRSA